MAPVKYSPLPEDSGSIRLLRLFPSDNPTISVECELFDENIRSEDRVPYEALSYTWGDSTQTVDIGVGECIFPATVNLEAALRALRKADEPRVLWIDAICINQEDLKEQGEQVRIMWDIYQAADCVLVWLGPADVDSSTAMDNFAAKEAQTRLPLRNKWNKEKPAGHEGRSCSCHAASWGTYPPRIGIQKLAERRWFSRIWVLQEVAAAKRITVVCGNKTVDGEDFRIEMIMSADYNRNFQHILPQIRPALELMNHAEGKPKVASKPLIELVESFRTWDATKPVDKVYALLGLSSDASNAPELRPDYTIPPSTLAHKLVRFAFPDAVINPQSAERQQVEFEIDGLLLGELSSWAKDNQTYWMIKTGTCNIPNAEFNPVVLKLFEETWTFRIPSERKLKLDSAVVFLRGATRPSVLSFHDGKYTVDILATPEPFTDSMGLVLAHANEAPPEFSGRGWDKVLAALSAETEKMMKFNLSWDPFRKLDPSEVSKFVPVPNSFETQYDAMLESLKDKAEAGSDEYHDCNTVSRYWAVFHHYEEEIKAGTWPHLMTLHKAAYSGYYGTLKLLLDANADVDARFSELRATPLHIAVQMGHQKIVRALIDGGATIDLREVYDKTALTLAAEEGHWEICKMLLDAGADPNPSGIAPNPLFMVAVMKSQHELVGVFLEAGVDADVGIPGGGPTPLHIAAEQGYVEVVKLLVASGAQVNPRICTGATPLHQAAVYGHALVATNLLEAGADSNVQETNGMTPLDNALYCGQMETAKVICLAGGLQNATVTGEPSEEEKVKDKTRAQRLREMLRLTRDKNGKANKADKPKPSPEEEAQMNELMLAMQQVSITNKNSVRKAKWQTSQATRLITPKS